MKSYLDRLFHRKDFRMWLFISGAILSAIFFEEVADDVFSDPVEGDFESKHFDHAIYQFFVQFKSPKLTQVMIDFTALGSVSVNFVLLIVLISVLFTYRDRKGIAYLAIVAMGAAGWPLILKELFSRPRPDIVQHLVNVNDLSFPSGHSFGATSIYMGLAFFAAKYAVSWRHEIFFYCLGLMLIALVGISRIYLGVHYPTDVLAGISGGACWAFTVSAVYTKIFMNGKESQT